MKVVKIIIGILSILISAVTALQTYALSVITSVAEDLLHSLGMTTGTVTMAIFLIGGLVGIILCDNKIGSIVAGVIYLAGAVIGFFKMGEYSDMLVWAIASAVFCVVFVLDVIFVKEKTNVAATTG